MTEQLPQSVAGVWRNRIQQQRNRLPALLQHRPRGRSADLELADGVAQLHDLGDGSVEGVARADIAVHALDGLVQLGAQRLVGRRHGRQIQGWCRAAFDKLGGHAPDATQEARHAFHARLTPFQLLIGRCCEHREQAHGVGAVLVDQGLRIDAIVLALAHLLDRTDGHRQAVSLERGTRHATVTVALDIDLGRVDPVALAIALAIEGLGHHHALTQEVDRRLVAVHVAEIAHGLVPEAEIQQMHDRMLDTADV